MRRIAGVVGGVVAAVALLAGGWLAATKLQSPAQRAAAASPPPPSPITFAVGEGELAERITARAAIGPAATASASLVLAEGRNVVTQAVAKKGSQVGPGDHVLSVSDRPVFALPGRFPLYRDLSYRDKGSDVSQVQQGLKDAGYAIPSYEEGTFGAATRGAIDGMYRKAGFSPPRQREAAAAASGEEKTSGGVSGEDQAAGTARPPAPVPYLPMSEVVIVSSLPQALISAPGLGTVLSAETATLEFGSSQLRAESRIPPASAAGLKPGLPVTIGEGKDQVAATIAKVTLPKGAQTKPAGPREADGSQEAETASGADAEDATVIYEPAKGKTFPKSWAGSDQLAEITVREIAADALLVPTIAIAGDSAGQANVLARQPDGSFLVVEVIELGASGGTSAIRPAKAAALGAGDLVRLDRG